MSQRSLYSCFECSEVCEKISAEAEMESLKVEELFAQMKIEEMQQFNMTRMGFCCEITNTLLGMARANAKLRGQIEVSKKELKALEVWNKYLDENYFTNASGEIKAFEDCKIGFKKCSKNIEDMEKSAEMREKALKDLIIAFKTKGIGQALLDFENEIKFE